MSNNINNPPTADDQDAAALLMLFQSQSSAPARSDEPRSEASAEPHKSQLDSSTPTQKVTTATDATATAEYKNTGDNLENLGQKAEEVSRNDTLKESAVKEGPQTTAPDYHATASAETSYSNNSIAQRPDLSAHSSSTNSNHSRSNSGNNFSTSPGPAAAALAVHNNKKSTPKNPNNIKAMVAAAALAAAAATPFPLLSHDIRKEPEPKVVEVEEIEVIKRENSVGEEKVSTVKTGSKSPSESLSGDITHKEETPDLEKVVTPSQEKTDVEADEAEINEILGSAKNSPPLDVDESTKAPTDASYYTDPDSGTIGCVCEYDHDDGFTIQCDRCFRWQHASCMGINLMEEVPEFYLCYLCDRSRKVDKAKARETQRDFLMPTSKRKRLNSMENDAAREEVLQAVKSVAEEPISEEETRRKSSTTSTREKERDRDNKTPVNNTARGRKPKPLPKKDASETMDDSELFSTSKDGYKTVYFPLTESEYRDENTRVLLKRLAEIIGSKKESFTAITDYSANDMKRKLSKSEVAVKSFGENVKMRFPGFSRFSLNIENNVNEDDFVCELIGEIQLKQDYIDNPFNHYSIWGVAKPKVFFLPKIPFVIDARYSGNEARFIRRSCTPSCEIKVLLLRNDNSIHFVVSPIRPLKAGQEITLPWDWDAAHPIQKIINKKTFDQLIDEEKPVLVRSIETVLNSCECACTNNNECYLYKVRKALAYLYRSTRKVNIPTFGNNLSKYADIYRQRDETHYVPIKKVLDERHEKILENLEREKPTPTEGEVIQANGTNRRNSLEDKKEFVIKHKRNPLSDLSDDLIPYKYKILQKTSSNPQESAAEIVISSVEPSVSTGIESFAIPVPILKPAVMNRAPSMSAAIVSSKAAIVPSSLAGDNLTQAERPPTKKKMSLKDYMKNKKK